MSLIVIFVVFLKAQYYYIQPVNNLAKIRGSSIHNFTFTFSENLDRLQRVQDVLARVVAQAPWSVSSTDLRRDFHWLPIRQRIVYKQCLMTYKAVHIGQPNYLNELIQPYQPVRTLRSPPVLYLSFRLLDLTLLLMLFPFLPPPSETISLRMFDHGLTRPFSNRD